MMRNRNGVYKYEHVNGSIISKPAMIIDYYDGGPREYFDSPFVKRWWYEPSPDDEIDTSDIPELDHFDGGN